MIIQFRQQWPDCAAIRATCNFERQRCMPGDSRLQSLGDDHQRSFGQNTLRLSAYCQNSLSPRNHCTVSRTPCSIDTEEGPSASKVGVIGVK